MICSISLFTSITGGTQIGSTIARPNTTLINGVFSVTLDFGAAAFTNPNAVFIEIGVKPNGSPNAFTILGPRQQLTVVPFAVRAQNATNADNATNAQNAVNATNADNATNAINATNATTANNSLRLGGVTAANFVRLDVGNQGDLTATGSLLINGNARQNRTSGGLVKVMLSVDRAGTIERCYNGVLGPTIPNCFFTVTRTGLGQYQIGLAFGSQFRLNDRFVSLSPHTYFDPQTKTNVPLIATHFLDPDETVSIFVQMVKPDNSFVDGGFTLIIY